jgi:HTH-type transcriptional regulator/antitoxin HigA
MDKGERRTAEEDTVLDLMVQLIKNYEAEHHPLPDPNPHEMLVYLMEQRGLKHNRKRAISETHARQLGEFFQVSPSLFI